MSSPQRGRSCWLGRRSSTWGHGVSLLLFILTTHYAGKTGDLETHQVGGHFQCPPDLPSPQSEWAPFSRDEGDENYPEMRKVFDGSSSLLRSYELVPGDLVLFRGRRSAHRVAPLGRDGGRRVVALLSYADEPDFYWRHLKPDKDGADPSYTSPKGQV